MKPGDDHELWCGLQRTRCRICYWNGCAKDLICHVKQCHEISLILANTHVNFLFFNHRGLAFFDQDQFFWVETEILDYFPSESRTVRYTLIPNGKICNSFKMQFVMENAQNKLVVSTKLSKESMLSKDPKFNSFSLPISVFQKFASEHQTVFYKFNLLQVN